MQAAVLIDYAFLYEFCSWIVLRQGISEPAALEVCAEIIFSNAHDWLGETLPVT
jgi:hypothetical protein